MIPFNRPPLLGPELANIRRVLEDRKLSGDGAFTERCSTLLEHRLGVPRVLLTHSCTGALEIAAILCDLAPGDEVIMPSYTFVSTANAVVLRGAVPVFVDVDPATLNIDPAAVEVAITPRTRAIFVVHYAGVPCDMDRISAIAGRHRLIVVEDAAQALGTRYRGRPAGTLGALGAISFHETKNVVSGEGGALAIVDPALIARAEIIREKGTNRSPFLRGEVDKYTWLDIGSSYLPSELIAAFLFPQLERIDTINLDRLRAWNFYHQALEQFEGRIRRPTVPEEAEPNGHLYWMLLRDETDRDAFVSAMKAQGIFTPTHYVPLHSSPAGRRFGRAVGALPVTTAVAGRLVRLPLYYGIGADAERVVEAVSNYLASAP